MSDLYKELGVNKKADKSEIKKAYRKKARVLHPDKQGGDREQFMQLQVAYDVLMDDEKRDLYDRTGQFQKKRGDEDEATIMVLNKMMQAVGGSEDFVTGAKQLLNVEKATLIREIADFKHKAQLWRKKAARVTIKSGGENLVAETLLHNAEQAEKTAARGEERLKVYVRALEIADNYEYKPDPQDPPAHSFGLQSQAWGSIIYEH